MGDFIDSILGAAGAKQASRPASSDFQISPDVQRQRDQDSLRIFDDEIANETDPDQKAALMRQRTRIAQRINIPQAQQQSARADDAFSVQSVMDGANLADQAPKVQTRQEPKMQGVPLFSAGIGAAENGLRTATNLFGSAVGGLAGIVTGEPSNVGKVENALTYEPRMDSGKAIENNLGVSMHKIAGLPGAKQAISGFNNLADSAGEVSPAAGAAIRTLPTAVLTFAAPEARGAFRSLGEIGKVADVVDRVEPVFGASKPRVKLNVDGSVTPVEAPSKAATIENASPELQQVVKDLQAKGVKVNQDVLNRHIEAETLPVPVKLTEGQATLDPAKISDEMNGRGQTKPTVSPEFYNQQAKALAENLDKVRAEVAPDVTTTHPTEMGQSLIDRYKKMDAPIKADIDAKYKALRDTNGGEFPVDAKALHENIRAALKKELLTNEAPASQMAEIERMAKEGSMSFEDFMSLRRNLGNIARTSADGNVRTAASTMIQQLEALPLSPEAAQLKPLADAARNAARARFEKLAADPAYNAAVSDGVAMGEPSPLADKFINGYVTGSNARLANIKQMKANLGNDPIANQVIAASTIDSLKGMAKADSTAGKFAADSYGKGVANLSPKLNDLVGEKAGQQLQQVGRVAKNTTVQPKGSYVNNSNTTVSALSKPVVVPLKNLASKVTLGGFDAAQDVLKQRKAAQAAKGAVSPGAGISSANAAPKKGVKISDLLRGGPAVSTIHRSGQE